MDEKAAEDRQENGKGDKGEEDDHKAEQVANLGGNEMGTGGWPGFVGS